MIKTKRYWIVNSHLELSQSLRLTLIKELTNFGWQIDKNNPEIVISIGGDGTMLDAFQEFADRLESVSFVVLHTGHLGFYSDWKPEEVYKLIISLANVEPKVYNYPLVQLELEDGKTFLALNEVTVKNPERTFVADIFINGELFEKFRGDGLCISTPSGSTAYNMSLGGSIIHPYLECMQLSTIAAINNREFRTIGSSIVLPKHHNIEIRLQQDQEVNVSCDRMQINIGDLKVLKLKVAPQKVNFIRYGNLTFWNRVKGAFIG